MWARISEQDSLGKAISILQDTWDWVWSLDWTICIGQFELDNLAEQSGLGSLGRKSEQDNVAGESMLGSLGWTIWVGQSGQNTLAGQSELGILGRTFDIQT